MFANPFDSARAKIERSHKHFRELISKQDAYAKAQQFEIELEPQTNGDTKGFAIIASGPSPESATIVSDIVGNFRASLDIAVSQACRVRGETNEKKLNKTYFAFGGSEKDWDLNSSHRMTGADKDIRTAVRSFRPWKESGNALLYALSKIAAKDKHVDLVPVAARPNEMVIDGLSMKREDGKASGVQFTVENWGQGKRVELFTVLAPAKVKITGPCVISPAFGFGKVYAMTGKPVIPTLNQMGAMCENIIDTIELVARS